MRYSMNLAAAKVSSLLEIGPFERVHLAGGGTPLALAGEDARATTNLAAAKVKSLVEIGPFERVHLAGGGTPLALAGEDARATTNPASARLGAPEESRSGRGTINVQTPSAMLSSLKHIRQSSWSHCMTTGSRRLSIIFSVFLFSVMLVAAENHRPNIIFIMSDDHAAHALSAYGSKINQTPQIDRLAREGMRFNRCFAVNSICTPSRACILTGKYSHINGVPVFNRFDGAQWTFPKALQSAGYYTGMVGKWHLFSDPTGFDYWNILPGQGIYHDPVMIENGQRKKLKGYVTDLITDISMDFLKNRPKDRPFLLMCHHKAPHRPWEPDGKHADLYDGQDIKEPATFNDDYAGRSSAAAEATMRIDRDLTRTDVKQDPPSGLSGEALKKWKYQRYIKDYLRCVASIDDNVGRLLDFLDKEGLRENTLVIYTSDQGFFLGDHNWFDKRFMYEESIRMPFLARYPGMIKPGAVDNHMVLNVDFAPTLLELAGVTAPSEVQGRSFATLLRGQKPKNWRESMYYRYYHYPQDHRVQPHYGVRTDRYKLIYFNKINEWELYDLKKDPAELRNLYNDPAQAKTVQRLKGELERLRRDLKDEDQFVNGVPDNTN